MRSIGLDVHKHFAEIAVLETGQEVQHPERIQTTPDALRTFARALRPTDRVVLEASGNTWPIAELLSAHAGQVIVSNPMRTRAIASAKVKTDRVDSAILAQLLAADFIPPVWAPDPATRTLRTQVAHHQSLVQQQTRLRNRIHAVLHRNLIGHSFTDLFGKAGRQWLAEVPLPAEERYQVDSALRLLSAVEVEIRLAEELSCVYIQYSLLWQKSRQAPAGSNGAWRTERDLVPVPWTQRGGWNERAAGVDVPARG